MDEREGDVGMQSEDKHAAYLSLAGDAGWGACADCGTWQPVSNMVVFEGYYYCPECLCDQTGTHQHDVSLHLNADIKD